MLQTYQIAKLIEKELNDNINATATGIKFKIHNAVGNYKKAVTKADGKKQRYVNGVLRNSTGNYTPVKGLNNLLSTLMLEFAVQQDDTEKVQLIIDSWSESIIGSVYQLDKTWQILITPQPAAPGTVKNTTPLGSTLPMLVVLEIQLIKDGLISNAVEWSINGQTVMASNVSMTFNRTPDVKPRANKKYCSALNQYEVRSISMVLPLSFSNINKQIANDLFSCNKDVAYTIKRVDGFLTDFEADFLLTSADWAEQSNKIVTMTLTFVPAADDEETE